MAEQNIEILDREGKPVADKSAGQEKILKLLYGNAAGRATLKILTKPLVSHLVGCALEHPLSTVAIPFFVYKQKIPLDDYAETHYRSFNSFFTRPVKPSARPIDLTPEAFISPCDAKLTVVPLSNQTRFTVKGAEYHLASLVNCRKLAARFEGGTCLIFRLTPDDYHHYCFPDDCRIGGTRCIDGVLHTVNPVSTAFTKVYHQNARNVTLLHTEHFGDVLQIEIGALFVGKIVNHPHGESAVRGMEKGYFAFGGSTIVLIVGKNRVEIDPQILKNSEKGAETVVQYGTRIGIAVGAEKPGPCAG